MSNIKIGSNQHLGVQELNRLKKFIVDVGYKKTFQQIFDYYGIPRLASDPSFLNLKVVPGSINGKLTVKAGVALDSALNLVTNPADNVDVLTVPGDSVLRYVKITYNSKKEEIGTLSINTSGILTGTGTKFTEVLRGVPFHPVKIKFTNSSGNLLEYTVVSVTNDTSAIIQGASFSAESNLTYKVVGTFTAGVSIPSGDKDIYEYDSCTISLSTSSSVTIGTQFVLARVSNDGTTTVIVDVRNNSLLTINIASAFPAGNISQTNALVGLESAMYDALFSDKSKNKVKIGWGFRPSSWTGNFGTFAITVTAGNGGIKSSPAVVANGDFNGWRVYFDNGNYAVISSTNSLGSTFEIILQNYDPAVHLNTGSIYIVPFADYIQFVAINTAANNATTEIIFPIESGQSIGDVAMNIGTTFLYFRHILKDVVTPYVLINDGSYRNESSFDANGNSINTNTSSVASGVFTLVTNNRNFYQTKANLKDANYFESFNGFAKGSVFSQTVVPSVSFSNVFNLNGNYFEITLPNSNNLQYNGFTFNPTYLPTNPFIFVKFSGTSVGHYLKKKVSVGTDGFDWNSNSVISDKVYIRAGDVYIFLMELDGSGGITYLLVSSYSNLRYNIDVLRKRINEPLFPSKAFGRM